MINILWLSNVVPQAIQKKLNFNRNVGGGWIDQLSVYVDSNEKVNLTVCAAYPKDLKFPCLNCSLKKEYFSVKLGKKSCFYGYRKQEYKPEMYDSSLEKLFKEIILEVKPDIVHIFGTEFPHTLAMVRAYNNPQRTVIHIQGLVSIYAKHYDSFLPRMVIKGNTFRDFMKRDNIESQRKKFIQRGKYEKEAIKNIAHVMGRTNWDFACTKAINPRIKYHFVQEAMREPFYSGSWDYEKCEKHSIFISQGGYPIKGLHLMLMAFKTIISHYPDSVLYVAGDSLQQNDGLKGKIRKTSYMEYIKFLIKYNCVEEKIKFVGRLNEEQMKDRFLKSNVFVLPSSIENSPNSIGEAMLLGVPIVASFVGGVPDLIDHKKEGLLYQADASYMLAYEIMEIFSNRELAKNLSKNARAKAKKIYCKEIIMEDLMKCYMEMLKINEMP